MASRAVTKVMFKDENEVNGIAIGPVILVTASDYIELKLFQTKPWARMLAQQLGCTFEEA